MKILIGVPARIVGHVRLNNSVN